ncbi:MAG: FG-GAP-like repeat-containing protein, partial [Planctomycetota bacterium]
CNRNREDDAEDIQSGRSEDCNADGIPDECQGLPLSFGVHTLFETNGSLIAFHGTDLDGDGRSDFILSSGRREEIDGKRREGVHLLSLRSGANVEVSFLPTSRRARSITSGDVDGDGDIDVITGSDRDLSIHRREGDDWLSEVLFEGREPQLLVAHDLTGDGDDEIFFADGETTDVVWLNWIDGAWRTATLTATHPVIGLAVDDLDGDGFADLVASHFDEFTVEVFYGAGDLRFDDPVEWRFRRRPIGGGIAILDVDGDGVLDLASAAGTRIEFRAGTGQREFAEQVYLVIRCEHSWIAGDFGGAGRLDIASAGSRGLSVHSNQGTWRFPLEFQSGHVVRQLFPSDVDDDGKLDIVATTSSAPGRVEVAYYRNGEFSPTFDFDFESSAVQHPHWGVLNDFDSDGDIDLVTTFNGAGLVTLLRNDGTGTLEAQDFDIGGRLIAFAGTDLNDDGQLDLALIDQTGRQVTLLTNQRGRFADPVPIAIDFAGLHIEATELNADGFPDFVVTGESGEVAYILSRDRARNYHAPQRLASGGGAAGAAVGDFDGDGDTDVAICKSSQSVVQIYSNDGRGILTETSRRDVRGPRFVVSNDLDRDGFLDLVTVNVGGTRTVSLLYGLGDGTFEDAIDLPIGALGYQATVLDLNGDGSNDILVASETDSVVSLLFGLGSRSYSVPNLLPVGAGPRWVGAADMDDDGDLDVVSANRRASSASVMLNRSPSVETEPFVTRLCTPEEFLRISIPSSSGAIERISKFVVPATGEGSVPALVQNVREHDLHLEFLRAEFPQEFGGVSEQEYDLHVGRRDTRRYFVGTLYQIRTREGPLYGFSVITSYFDDRSELPRLEEVESVYRELRQVVGLEPFAYFPDDRLTREQAEDWDADFPVHLDDPESNVEFRAYTQAIGMGRVRVLTDAEFREANERGELTFQDILVLESAPRDIEGVVAGVVTGTLQGDLSHLAIRTARRGTPNAFVRDALAKFEDRDGQLARLEVNTGGYRVLPASPSEVEEFWRENRPRLSRRPSLDVGYRQVLSLEEVSAIDGGEIPNEARFGGKASQFARLQSLLRGSEFQELEAPGLAIPIHYYHEFAVTNRIESVLRPGETISYRDYVREVFENPDLLSDSRRRFSALKRLRDHMRSEGVVPESLVRSIAVRIAQVFGSTNQRVRFRSSSNAEDSLEFNGAGLYDSSSACAADDLDVDEQGPSACDAGRREERGIARALRTVWSSLWNFRAVEERRFYGIGWDEVGMGVLVSRAFPNEASNGVAFTGNPQNPFDRRYFITAQIGDQSVVSPEPGTIAERSFVDVEFGEVVRVDRETASNLVAPGEFVVSNEQLVRLGRAMAFIDERFPLQLGDTDRSSVILDFEFKFLQNGELAIKQVRPFLFSGDPPPAPAFALTVPTNTEVCGSFVPFRSPLDTLRLKARLHWATGVHVLPTRQNVFRADLFETLTFGPKRRAARPLDSGVFRVQRIPRDEVDQYRFDYSQDWELDDGTPVTLRLVDIRFDAEGSVALSGPLRIDEDFFASALALEAEIGNGDDAEFVPFGSCLDRHLPRWRIEYEFEGGRLELTERYEPAASINETGPASLRSAEVRFGDEQRSSDEYWNLAYTSLRHNLDARYWLRLEPPISIPEGDAAFVELYDPNPVELGGEEVRWISSDGERLAMSAALDVRKSRAEIPVATFRRGDVDANGAVELTDAVSLLNYLFRAAAPPNCESAGDAVDDGVLNLSDPIAILAHLFLAAGPLPEPFAKCGDDPSLDELRCVGGFCAE